MDRISSLPDSLRNRIVSFLPLEDAIRTSSLSRRWSNVCSSLTNFDFHQPTFDRKSRRKRDFKDFVNQTLVLQDGLDIHKFTLSAHLDDLSPILVNSWLSFAVNRNVKEIYLCVLYRRYVENLPSCLFTCNTLTVLTLHNINLNLPRLIVFPKLQTLKLTSVRFVDGNLTNQLFSTCPLLEELFISDCFCYNFDLLKISAPNLKFLELSTLYGVIDIEISTRNLRKFRYFGSLPNISFETLVSLLEVEFQTLATSDFVLRASGDVFYRRASYLILGLQNVHRMMLQGVFVEFLTRDQGSLAYLPTITFRLLQHLQLDIYPTKNQVQVVILLLKSCPNLNHLRLCIQAQHTSRIRLNMEEYQQPQETSTDSSLKNLKAVDIEPFQGSDSELDLVRFLLENADTMEKLNIIYSPQKMADALSLVSISEAIRGFNKASPCVVVSLY